ncbi:MAG: hypothetical protein Q9167_003465 [Letrouitia subvulpina]
MDYTNANTALATIAFAAALNLGAICYFQQLRIDTQQLEIQNQRDLVTETMLKMKRAQQLLEDTSAQLSSEILFSPVESSAPVGPPASSILNLTSLPVYRVPTWLAITLISLLVIVTVFAAFFVNGRRLMRADFRNRATTSLNDGSRTSLNRSFSVSHNSATNDTLVDALLSLVIELQTHNIELRLNLDDVSHRNRPMLSIAPITSISIAPVEEERIIDESIHHPHRHRQILSAAPLTNTSIDPVEERSPDKAVHDDEQTSSVAPLDTISSSAIEEAKSSVCESAHDAKHEISSPEHIPTEPSDPTSGDECVQPLQPLEVKQPTTPESPPKQPIASEAISNSSTSGNETPAPGESSRQSSELKRQESSENLPAASPINSEKAFISPNPLIRKSTERQPEGRIPPRKPQNTRHGGQTKGSLLPKWLRDELEEEEAAAAGRSSGL